MHIRFRFIVLAGCLNFFILEAREFAGGDFSTAEISEETTPSYMPKKPLVKKQNDEVVDNTDGMLTLLTQYAPILYLHPNERYWPISAEEYFTGRESGVSSGRYQKDKRVSVIIPEGSVTFEKLYALRTDMYKQKFGQQYKQAIVKDSKVRDENQYIAIGERVKFGSNPAENKDKNGALRTPAYMLAWQQNGHIYLQYIFLYGFNGPYRKNIAGKTVGYLGAHEADLEHFTIELDEATKKPLRYFYASHGRDSGVVVKANQIIDVKRTATIPTKIQAEREGDHPIVYLAKKAHGTYPKRGTYLRMGGAANDLTASGTRWEPNFIRIYPDTDARFNADSMGWLYTPTALGRRGVAPVYVQGWFMNADQDILDKEARNITKITPR